MNSNQKINVSLTTDEIDKLIQDLTYLKTAPLKTIGQGYAKQLMPHVVHLENTTLKISYWKVDKKEKQSMLLDQEQELDLMEDE